MRVLLVGTPVERARLRARLNGAGLDVIGEFPTARAARDAGVDADGVLTVWGLEGLGPREEIDEPLTPREREVLELLAEGLSNKAVAARLGISDQTVKFHVASISSKLGAANRTDAVRRAVRRGLITL